MYGGVAVESSNCVRYMLWEYGMNSNLYQYEQFWKNGWRLLCRYTLSYRYVISCEGASTATILVRC